MQNLLEKCFSVIRCAIEDYRIKAARCSDWSKERTHLERKLKRLKKDLDDVSAKWNESESDPFGRELRKMSYLLKKLGLEMGSVEKSMYDDCMKKLEALGKKGTALVSDVKKCRRLLRKQIAIDLKKSAEKLK